MLEKHRVIKGESLLRSFFRSDLAFIVGVVVFIWIIVPINFGIINNTSTSKCLKNPVNLAMFVPTYKLGCWLGATQGEQWYYKKK